MGKKIRSKQVTNGDNAKTSIEAKQYLYDRSTCFKGTDFSNLYHLVEPRGY